MAGKGGTIRLYAMQAPAVLETLERDGVCFSRSEYIRDKYKESAPIFLTAYTWLARNIQGLVPRPEAAELPYWAFADVYSLDKEGEGSVLVMDVPRDEAVFFDMYDWNKVLQLKYLAQSPQDEGRFRQEMRDEGLTENKIMLTGFYPQWKSRVYDSWKGLLRHHEAIKNGDTSGVASVQAALWQIKKEWIVEKR